jgi:hypothetical protein
MRETQLVMMARRARLIRALGVYLLGLRRRKKSDIIINHELKFDVPEEVVCYLPNIPKCR